MSRSKRFKVLYSMLAAAFLFCTGFSASLQAAPYAYRNDTFYPMNNGGPPTFTSLTVVTYPSQPYSPVYSWRKHTRYNGSQGPLGYNGTLIGYTDGSGSFIISGMLGYDLIYCGKYTNETFAVGSLYGQRSSPLSFGIGIGTDFGPIPPC